MRAIVALLLAAIYGGIILAGTHGHPAPAPVCTASIESPDETADPFDDLVDVLQEMVRQGGMLRVLCNLKPETPRCEWLPGPRAG